MISEQERQLIDRAAPFESRLRPLGYNPEDQRALEMAQQMDKEPVNLQAKAQELQDMFYLQQGLLNNYMGRLREQRQHGFDDKLTLESIETAKSAIERIKTQRREIDLLMRENPQTLQEPVQQAVQQPVQSIQNFTSQPRQQPQASNPGFDTFSKFLEVEKRLSVLEAQMQMLLNQSSQTPKKRKAPQQPTESTVDV